MPIRFSPVRTTIAAAAMLALIASPAIAASVTPGSTPTAWEDVTTPGGPRLANSASAFDSARRQLVTFGGAGIGGVSGATWVWNGATWTDLNLEVSPTARRGAAMAYDAARREVVLFGGFGDELYGDTWVFDGHTWTERSPAVSPPANLDAAMVYDPTRREVVMFGGATFSEATWVWDGETWAERTSAKSPTGRYSHGMAYDRSRDAVVLFGGFNDDGRLGDTWTWNGRRWHEETAVQRPPGLRTDVSMASFGRRVAFFGGNLVPGPSDETWVLRDRAWKQLVLDVSPPARAGAQVGWDRRNHRLVVNGGRGEDGFLRDTWVLER